MFFDTYLTQRTPPPRYGEHGAGPSMGPPENQPAPPPYYLEQIRFPVGGKVPKWPFVTITQLKAHLGLLRALRELKNRVTDLEANQDVRDKVPPLARGLEAQQRWIWFLELALERFHRWTSNLTTFLQPNATIHNPPLDVWLIWHAYMLNPTRYAEDLFRIKDLQVLKKVTIKPLHMLETMGNISEYRPERHIVQSWEKATGLPWDPFDSCAVRTQRELVCPKCRILTTAPYLAPGNTGRAQQNFTSVCRSCGFVITREKLAVAKFVDDLTKDPKNLGDVSKFGDAVYLPGTLLTRARTPDKHRAKLIKASIYSSKDLCYHLDERHKRTEDWYSKPADTVAWGNKILESVGYELDPLTRKLHGCLKAPMLRRVMSAYTDDRPYSLDLVSAVQRQGVFTDKMHDLGWSQPGYFDGSEDEVALMHCTARYHAFLDLISSSPYTFFVPTLDIDIAWHTHQLDPEKYFEDCISFVHRFVNHDDTVEEGHLSTSFDITCRAWQERFGVRYMYCGCPLPGNSIGPKLSRLSASFFSRGKSPVTPPNRNDSLLATHPSDHNAVYVENVTRQRRLQLANNAHKSKDSSLKKFKRGQADHEIRGLDWHDSLAFLVPVPLDFGYGSLSGIPSGPDGGCAAGGCGGGISAGGCSSSGSGCGGAGCGNSGGCGGGGHGGNGGGGGDGGHGGCDGTGDGSCGCGGGGSGCGGGCGGG